MSSIVLAVLAISALLGLSAFVPALAERLRLPATTVLALAGMLIGGGLFLAHGRYADELPVIFSALVNSLASLSIPPDTLLLVFLPVLLFESSISLDARALRDDAVPVLTMAVLAVLVTTVVVGLSLNPFTVVPLAGCLLLGAVVATTDPIAVIGVFREVGAPRRLSDLVEGESLLNDAAAIALFGAFVSVLQVGGDGHPAVIASTFVWDFIGGGLFGVVLGRLGAALLTKLDSAGPAEITLSLALAYLAYIVGEHVLHISGVVATVAAGVVFGFLGRRRVSAPAWAAIQQIWQQLGFWAASLVFVLAAMLIPKVLADFHLGDLLLLVILIAATFVARIFVLYVVIPLLAALKLAKPIRSAYRAVMLWGGLRGAVTLALALAVTEIDGIGEDVQHLVEVVAVSYVLFTLFVQGTTLRALIGWLGLNQLGPLERMVRDRAIELSQSNMLDQLRTEAGRLGINPDTSPEIDRLYKARMATPRRVAPLGDDMLAQQLSAALLTLTRHEAELYVAEIGRALVGRRTASQLLSNTDQLQDALQTDGARGYRSQAKRLSQFDVFLRASVWLQRTLRWSGPLAMRLADRFEVMLVSRRVLSEVEDFAESRLPMLFERRVAETALHVVQARREQTERSFEALELQYPEYAEALRTRYMDRAALRMEEDAYGQMLQERLITPPVYRDLMEALRERKRRLEKAPKLDLRMDVPSLLHDLPLFQDLDPEQLAAMSRLLRPRLALPRERIVRQGEAGDRMFFIASGAVEVVLPEPIRLGTGDFFGELGLITHEPRRNDVVALGYCQLLELHTVVFERFLRADPQAADAIRRVAAERLGVVHMPETEPG
ncbi:MAG TPA: cation:proton antiporter [Geminicoccus sp.]|uniref:cation:proton antiporter n=1 Tax=Geminicoccus sp. TaxID=2024832 RepID=UPI002E32AC91|nr:cation:proton antiporter [Geminicoccus sp.]HEX2528320.1 cation:proton antiporter [Geminicoccus sp.]